MTTLATLRDVAAITGTSADPTDLKLVRALDAASGLVRAYVGRTLDQVEDDELTLHGTGTYTLLLPEGPVAEVSLVEELDSDGDATEIDADDYRLEGDKALLHRLDEPWCEGVLNYRITLTYGYTLPGTPNPTLPPEIRAVTAQIAARLYQQATDEGRQVTQRSIGSYSESYEASEGPQMGLEPAETAVLARYRWGGLA